LSCDDDSKVRLHRQSSFTKTPGTATMAVLASAAQGSQGKNSHLHWRFRKKTLAVVNAA